ncbi:Uncharacterised protein [Bordetella pertussis]|nr:Uncharacterised protein [Bordetella pertussis]CFW49239.1 Uncharacterised protein [Bordetella pertussis]CPK13842.1 Uncharacterised protein [Bordetella pertussis]CPK68146.1 Uncharacterised protein [Bordetella pertussis]CPL06527.1 Uncharacterised protein [Bordetella pertussis]
MTSISAEPEAARACASASASWAGSSTRMPVQPQARAMAVWFTGAKATAEVWAPNLTFSACFWKPRMPLLMTMSVTFTPMRAAVSSSDQTWPKPPSPTRA